MLKEVQHEFAVASTEYPSDLWKNGSKENQSWWYDQSAPRVSCGVVTSSDYVEQGEHKYRRSAEDWTVGPPFAFPRNYYD